MRTEGTVSLSPVPSARENVDMFRDISLWRSNGGSLTEEGLGCADMGSSTYHYRCTLPLTFSCIS